jgi:general stress protein 26
MGEMKALESNEAIAKISHIAKSEVAMFGTHDANGTLQIRPMSTAGVDPNGTIWFMSRRSSAKNKEIAANAKVRLIYAVPARSEYLTVDGHAEITRDQKKLDELWNVFAKTWFHEGKDDPELTLLKVTPKAGYYWDTKHSKMVQMAMIAVGALTGLELDDGVQGTLHPKRHTPASSRA